jgi:5-methylcytosine-specific restriction endonuclease McrA
LRHTPTSVASMPETKTRRKKMTSTYYHKLTPLAEITYQLTKRLHKAGLMKARWARRLTRIIQYKSFYYAWPADKRTRHRRVLLKMQGFCEECGCDDVNLLTVDHITELADGGTDTLSNKQMLCRVCHVKKTKKSQQKRNVRNQKKILLTKKK